VLESYQNLNRSEI